VFCQLRKFEEKSLLELFPSFNANQTRDIFSTTIKLKKKNLKQKKSNSKKTSSND
jgi:hypothetical protein